MIELLIVLAITGMLGAVIVACLAGGVRVWERAGRFGKAEGAALIALEEIEQSLRNIHRFQAVPFEGKFNSMSFCSMIKKIPLGTLESEENMGTAKYLQPSASRGLIRKEWFYPENEPPDFTGDVILSSLNSLEFSFYKEGNGDAAKGGVWTDDWISKTNYPARVHIQLVLNRENDEMLTMERTVLIPVRSQEDEQ